MILLIGVMLVLMLLGVPVAYAIGIASLLYVVFMSDMSVLVVAQQTCAGADSLVMVALPFFLLAGEIMNESGITHRLTRFAMSLIGPVHGGLSQVVVVANVLVAMVQKGLIGEIKKATVCVGGGPTSPVLPEVPVPEILDYELWIGPAPMVPYRASEARMDFRERKAVWPRQSNVFYNFRWWLDYSGGKLTDIGAHQIDMCLWALNRNGAGMGPVKIIPHEIQMPAKMENGVPVEKDRYNTPNQFRIECVYEDGFVLEVVSKSPDGAGVLLEGTKGRLHYNGGRIKGKPYEIDKVQETLTNEDFRKIRKGKEWMSHKANFIACIKEGGEPISDVASHVQAMNVCHLCVLAARLGREITWDPKSEKMGDDQAQSFFARKERKGYEIPREL